MYLVLTALLALNVSAEIFNAFEMVDGGLKRASASLDASNAALPATIKESAKKKASLQVYADRIDPVRALSKEGTDYLADIWSTLIDRSGDNNGVEDEGDYVMVKDKRVLKGKKNYDGTTKYMVDEGKGEEMVNKLKEIKQGFLSFIDTVDRKEYESKIPIEIDEESWKTSINKKASWADFTFGHMPLGATQPIFSKFQNDIKASESAVLNYLAGKVGLTKDVVLDKFRVVSAPKKSYVIKGEKYEADIFLSAAAGGDSKTGISISVDGRNLPTDKDGNAKYTSTTTSSGSKKYNAKVSVTNPVTGETDTYTNTFEYEVGERSVAISPTKMNVFYIGVDNPVEISAAGVNSNNMKVSMSGPGGGTINKNGDGTYTVKVTKPTRKGEFAKINVSADGMNANKEFRVKRIPDPSPKLGKNAGGVIKSGIFKASSGIFPVLEGFDFDAKCRIESFVLEKAAKRQDIEVVKNTGGKFQGKAIELVKSAKPSDRYYMTNIKCKCPGDVAPRSLGQMVFIVK